MRSRVEWGERRSNEAAHLESIQFFHSFGARKNRMSESSAWNRCSLMSASSSTMTSFLSPRGTIEVSGKVKYYGYVADLSQS